MMSKKGMKSVTIYSTNTSPSSSRDDMLQLISVDLREHSELSLIFLSAATKA